MKTEKIIKFIKKEAVFCTAFLAAVISSFIVPPSKEYIGYINFSVLALLFCLMTTVEGFKQNGILSFVANKLAGYAKDMRMLCLVLTSLCFFASMLMTNDVSLIAFVPITVLLMEKSRKNLLITVVIETLAANLGSMLTPIGNPQNLFIYERSGMNAGKFILTMLPLTVLSYIMICLCCFLVKKENVEKIKNIASPDKKGGIICSVLFIICILTVLHIIPYILCIAIVAAVFLIYKRNILLKTDYMLLLTFVCFFIFSGNISNIPWAKNFLSGLLEKHTLETSLLCSQIISNVPATVLLYPFCENIKQLLYGVDIGGLGTPVASLASLISYRIYISSKNAKSGKYLFVFTVLNIIFLAVLYAAAKIFLSK